MGKVTKLWMTRPRITVTVYNPSWRPISPMFVTCKICPPTKKMIPTGVYLREEEGQKLRRVRIWHKCVKSEASCSYQIAMLIRCMVALFKHLKKSLRGFPSFSILPRTRPKATERVIKPKILTPSMVPGIGIWLSVGFPRWPLQIPLIKTIIKQYKSYTNV